MPHKQRRDKKHGEDLFELPPTSVAAPLRTSKSSTKSRTPAKAAEKKNVKRKRARKNEDDTPRAFARLMAWQHGAKPRSGLDDGAPKPKKCKRESEQVDAATETTDLPNNSKPEIPKMLPGERMLDYSARVDAALPLKGLVHKGKDILGVKRQQTKNERKLQRMQKEWREIDARYKDRLLEAQEEDEDDEDPHQATLDATQVGRKKRKAKEMLDDDDPWAGLAKARREKEKERAGAGRGLVGIHDVVLAPPELKAPKEKFKTKNGAKIAVLEFPRAAGSLRKREELSEARRSVVEGYRQMMQEKRDRPSIQSLG